MSCPSTMIVPEVGAPQARDGVDQLGLAVAVDARDAHDLARAHLEREAAHGFEPAVVVHDEVLHLQARLRGLRRGLVDASARRRGRP